MKIKDYYLNDAEQPSEARIRRLMIKQLCEYRVESTSLRELLTLLHDNIEKEYDMLTTEAIRKEYDKLFCR